MRFARLTPLGEPPSPRAAHVATAVGTMVVIQVPSLALPILLKQLLIQLQISYLRHYSLAIQGGIGPAGLSAEDLHVLDLTQQRPRWHR
jgi:hypothetical protein